MNSFIRPAVFFICILCLAGTTTFAAEEEQGLITLDGPCCFENPRFSGTCQIQAGPEETCGSILGYLNNPNSVGKNYCGNTKVRGGWTKVSCQSEGSTEITNSCEIPETRE